MAIRWVDKDKWCAKRHVVIGDAQGIFIHPPGMWENFDGPSPSEWFAVSDSDGIFAYASNQSDAKELAVHFTQSSCRETMEEHIQRAYSK